MMNYLQSICNSDVRISEEFRNRSLGEVTTDVLNFIDSTDKSQVTNPHVLNLISLILKPSKKVVSIESAGKRLTGDLEVAQDTHSYWANGTPVHNTVNLPNEYSFSDFENIYLDAYNTGYIKGITTYRAGTMTSVLAAVEEKNADAEEEIILEDAKLPDSLPATLKTLRAEGRKWYLTLLQNEAQTRPVALFVQTNALEKNITANDAVEKLLELARVKGVPEKYIESTKAKTSHDNNPTRICRSISLCLRHGVMIKSIVQALDQVDCIAGSFVFHIRKFLATFIKDGEQVAGEICPECGSSKIVYQEGCKVCANCGNSKCG